MRRFSFSTIFIPLLITFFAVGPIPAKAITIGGIDVSIGSSGGGDHVTIVGDVSDTSVTNALKNTLAALGIEKVSGDISELITKEKILDPIQWAMSKQFQQQLTGDVLKWLGGQLPGQNGAVPFVQDYVEHYLGISVEIGGSFIFDGELSGLCSDEEDFVVKEQVYKFLANNQTVDGQLFSCPDDNADQSEDTLARMARRISTCSTPVCAQYEAKRELALRQLQAVENERDLLDRTKGMLAQKVCNTATDALGISRTDCNIVSPPSLSSDALTFNLVDLPGLQLLNMDEFNESVSNLMANLTNQALTSVTGALGLTGNPTYSNNVFGSSGTLSYVDALQQDNVSDYQSFDASPIDDSLTAEQTFFQIQQEIISEVNRVEAENNDHVQEFGSCYDLSLTSELEDARSSAQDDLDISATTIAVLSTLKEQYDAATDSATKVSLLGLYQQYNTQGLFHTDLQNQDLVVSYLDSTFAEMIDLFEYDMSVEVQKCD